LTLLLTKDKTIFLNSYQKSTHSDKVLYRWNMYDYDKLTQKQVKYNSSRFI